MPAPPEGSDPATVNTVRIISAYKLSGILYLKFRFILYKKSGGEICPSHPPENIGVYSPAQYRNMIQFVPLILKDIFVVDHH